MYAKLWHAFPGQRLEKTLSALVLLVLVLDVLFIVVFPRLEKVMPFQDVNVDKVTSTPAAPRG